MVKQIPAWGTPAEWSEVNHALDYLLGRYKNDISRVENTAWEIQKTYEKIFPVQNQLCSETCIHCPDPCCLNATVWADLKDLLFYHLTNQKIPDRQLIENPEDLCVYHSSAGCRLPRLSRPFTCTLYLCPSQTAKFRLLNADVRNNYEKNIKIIKQSRKDLEDLFIELSAHSKIN